MRLESLEPRAMLSATSIEDPLKLAGWAGSFAAVGDGALMVSAMVSDASSNRYVGGSFSGEFDFDPSDKQEIRSASSAGFVAKFDAAGKFLSVITFDASPTDDIPSASAGVGALAISATGKLAVAGTFTGTVDFNPSEVGVAERTGSGAFALVLGTAADWPWQNSLMTYEDDGGTAAAGVTRAVFADATNLYLGGWISSFEDGTSDAFVLRTKFSDADGIDWERTLGGTAAYPGDLVATPTGVVVTAMYTGELATVTKLLPLLTLPEQGGLALSLKADGSPGTWARIFPEQATYLPGGTPDDPVTMPLAASADGATVYVGTTTDNEGLASSTLYAIRASGTSAGQNLWMKSTSDLFGDQAPASVTAQLLAVANGNLYVGGSTLATDFNLPQLGLTAINPATGATKGTALLALGDGRLVVDAGALAADGRILFGGTFGGTYSPTVTVPAFRGGQTGDTLQNDGGESGFFAAVANPFVIAAQFETFAKPLAGLDYVTLAFSGGVASTATSTPPGDSFPVTVIPIGAFSLKRNGAAVSLAGATAYLSDLLEPTEGMSTAGRSVSLYLPESTTSTPGTYTLSFDLSKLGAADRAKVSPEVASATIGTATTTFTIAAPTSLLVGSQGFAAAITSDFINAGAVAGNEPIEVRDVVTDSTGRVYVAGSFMGTADFDPSAGNASRTSTLAQDEFGVDSSTQDGFVAVYDANGGFKKVITFPGSGRVRIDKIAVDGAGNLVAAGHVSGENTGLATSSEYEAVLFSLDTATGAISNLQECVGVETFLELKRGGDGVVFAIGTFYDQATIGQSELVAASEFPYFMAAFAPSADPAGGLLPIAASSIEASSLNLSGIWGVDLAVTSAGVPVLGVIGVDDASVVAVLAGINTSTGTPDWTESVALPEFDALGFGHVALTADTTGKVFAGFAGLMSAEAGGGVGPAQLRAYQVTKAPAEDAVPQSSVDGLWSIASLQAGIDGYDGLPDALSVDDDGAVYVGGYVYESGGIISDDSFGGSFLLRVSAADGSFEPKNDLIFQQDRESYGSYDSASGKFVRFGYESGLGYSVNGPAASKAAPSFIIKPNVTANFVSVLANPFATANGVPMLALSDKSDSGASNSDRITNVLVPVFTGTAEAGSLVTVYAQSVVSGVPSGSSVKLGTATAAAGSGAWSFTTPANKFTAGDWLVKATQTVDGVEGKAASLSLSIDRTAPASPTGLDLDAESDTGVEFDPNYNTDNYTADILPTITGSAEDGSTVKVFANATLLGTTVAADGVWTLMPVTALKDGTYAITATATDLAGNESVASVKTGTGSLSITIDTKAPAAPSVPDLIAADDKGSSNTDNKTSVTTPTFTGTSEPLAFIAVYVNAELVGGTQADGKGAWKVQIPEERALPDGTHFITAQAVDRAGNPGVDSKALQIQISTLPPEAPEVTLNAKSDSGVKDDGITNVTLPIFGGTAPAGTSVNLYRAAVSEGGFDLETASFLGLAKVVASKGAVIGTWSLTTPSKTPFTNGDWAIVARTADEFGAESEPAIISLGVDTVGPAAPADLDLDPASDLGAVDDDNYTSDTTPTISGTAEVGSTVTVLANAIVLGTVVAEDGTWSVTPSKALVDGVYTITAKAVDVAGNAGVASAKSGTGSLSITIDTKATPPSVPDLIAADDLGSSNTDNKTSVTTPTFTGTAEAFATVTLLANSQQVGSGVANSKGAWTIKLDSALGDGTYSVVASSVDKAGNASAASKALAPVVISTAAPADPTISLSAASDSGLKGDGVTNNLTPGFSGQGPAAAKVNVYRVIASSNAAPTLLGTATVGSAKSGGLGAWSLATAAKQPFTENDWRVIAKTVDTFGNESTGAEVPLTVNRSAPVVTQWTQESAQSVVVTFSRPVTGLKASSLRGIGKLGATNIDLPLTDSRVVAVLGTSTVTAVSPVNGYSDTWRITCGKSIPAGVSLTLKLKAAGAGITDTIANSLTADSQTTVSGNLLS